MSGALYVVATPIGNLGDMSARALEVLQAATVIAAEDTRHSGKLLHHFGIKTKTIALHDHNERMVSESIVARLQAGETVALVSDAGTPLISDPGYHLVAQARAAGCQVIPVPGASALLAALSASGLPSDRFTFEGFLPAKAGARRAKLEQLQDDPRTLVFYEAPHRIEESIAAMAAVFGGERPAVIARELTKTFETIHGDTLSALSNWLAADANQRRGEFVVMVGGAPQAELLVDAEAERVLCLLLEEVSLKQAAALAAKITGVKKNLLYQFALDLAR
ncbi:MAG: 16S rRNA (cytidine(1402)-2'-O)-methyltransferase [Thiotrichaceae bacterium]|nr:16S rRNA (cytidine(1402)-2'-O)-methyltransferase [Thiotrichaceae bacterium]